MCSSRPETLSATIGAIGELAKKDIEQRMWTSNGWLDSWLGWVSQDDDQASVSPTLSSLEGWEQVILPSQFV